MPAAVTAIALDLRGQQGDADMHKVTAFGENAKHLPDRHGQLGPVKLDQHHKSAHLIQHCGSAGISRQIMQDLLNDCPRRLQHEEYFSIS